MPFAVSFLVGRFGSPKIDYRKEVGTLILSYSKLSTGGPRQAESEDLLTS